LISVVTERQPAEITVLDAGAMIADMGTQDYWIYSIGLGLVTFIVLVA
jgi:hypothetical protein